MLITCNIRTECVVEGDMYTDRYVMKLYFVLELF